jgi:hypothetical protein
MLISFVIPRWTWDMPRWTWDYVIVDHVTGPMTCGSFCKQASSLFVTSLMCAKRAAPAFRKF